jgi:glycosyltransferase involved in cell wall biosynthesis
VIVIDNGSDEPLEPVVAAFPHATLTTERRPGSYAARNRGIALAKGDVVAFTDSDCVPAMTWLAAGVSRLLHTPHCGLVGGKIEIVFRDPQRPTAAELWTSVTSFNQERNIEVEHFAATGNLFTFRTILDSVGLFDPTLRSGGDVVWGRRVNQTGYRQVYAEEARVTHPAIASLRHLASRFARFTGRRQYFRHELGDPDVGMSWYVITDLSRCVSFFTRVWRGVRSRSTKDKAKVLAVVAFVHAVVLWEGVRLRLGGAPKR